MSGLSIGKTACSARRAIGNSANGNCNWNGEMETAKT